MHCLQALATGAASKTLQQVHLDYIGIMSAGDCLPEDESGGGSSKDSAAPGSNSQAGAAEASSSAEGSLWLCPAISLAQGVLPLLCTAMPALQSLVLQPVWSPTGAEQLPLEAQAVGRVLAGVGLQLRVDPDEEVERGWRGGVVQEEGGRKVDVCLSGRCDGGA